MLVLNVRIACLVPDLLVIGLNSIMLFLFMLNFFSEFCCSEMCVDNALACVLRGVLCVA